MWGVDWIDLESDAEGESAVAATRSYWGAVSWCAAARGAIATVAAVRVVVVVDLWSASVAAAGGGTGYVAVNGGAAGVVADDGGVRVDGFSTRKVVGNAGGWVTGLCAGDSDEGE